VWKGPVYVPWTVTKFKGCKNTEAGMAAGAEQWWKAKELSRSATANKLVSLTVLFGGATLYNIYILHLWYVYSTFAAHLQYMYITFTSHLHYIYITFTLHLHYIYITFSLYLQYIHITFTVHSHQIYMTFTLQLHYIYITATLHLHYIQITFTLQLHCIYKYYIYIRMNCFVHDCIVVNGGCF